MNCNTSYKQKEPPIFFGNIQLWSISRAFFSEESYTSSCNGALKRIQSNKKPVLNPVIQIHHKNGLKTKITCHSPLANGDFKNILTCSMQEEESARCKEMWKLVDKINLCYIHIEKK